MKIQIITERDISGKEFWLWAQSAMEAVNHIAGFKRLHRSDFQQLLEKGEMSFEDDLGYTKAKTIYRILK